MSELINGLTGNGFKANVSSATSSRSQRVLGQPINEFMLYDNRSKANG